MTAAACPVASEAPARALHADIRALADVDLLTLVLSPNGQSRSALRASVELLAERGHLAAIAQLGAAGLTGRRGIDARQALRLSAAFELGHRATVRALSDERETIGSFESVVAWARPRLAALEHEEVWVLCLDGRNGLVCARRIAQGGLHGCALTARDVLRPALRDAASAIVLVHNHPSGEPGPSTEDMEMTRAVAIACDVVGVPLLDHVIVARAGATSLLELGALPA